MNSSGSQLVVAMGLIALAAGVGGWCYQYSATARSAEFWGQPGAQLITNPQTVRVLKLLPLEVAKLQGQPILSSWPNGYVAIASEDVSNVHGLSHLRYALVQDRNFDWAPTEPSQGAQIQWRFALEFTDQTDRIAILFSDDWRSLGRLANPARDPVLLASPTRAEQMEHCFWTSASLKGFQ